MKAQDELHKEFEESLQMHQNIADLWKLETVGINLSDDWKDKKKLWWREVRYQVVGL